jgi:hypothetical protein
MRVSSPVFVRILLALMLALAGVARAVTPLTDLGGQWNGGGTDRDGPFASQQATRCHATVQTDPTHLTSTTQCDGEAGLHKSFHLSIVFAGDQFTGSVEQVSSVRGGPPTRYAGTVTGSREGDVATFTAHFGALTPNAHIVLTLTSPTSYSMRVSVLGSTLTDVTLRRAAR